ncbi:hypothetical protein ACSNOI_24535 [Actinomadura kijaniata]|uniref:hypothetical protein n=1 Tax=Actinomadura kijaniata TaxID=46161 RepID=UPI003F1C5C7C
MRKRLGALAMAGVTAAATVAATSPAHALSTGWVYLVYPTWLGNCPNASVAGIQAATDYSSTNWDMGDDIVYLKVALNRANRVNANLMCKKFGRIVGYQVVTRGDIVPTRHGQTIWLGPSGWRRN